MYDRTSYDTFLLRVLVCGTLNFRWNQYIWRNWKEAVRSYNGNPKLVEEYVKEVFSIYEKGVDLEENILW